MKRAMDLKDLLSCVSFLLTVALSSSSPVSHRSKSASSTPSSSYVSLFSVEDIAPRPSSKPTQCSPVEVAKCSTFYSAAQMPNVFGDYSQIEVSLTLRDVLSKLGSTNKLVTSFLCSVYIPPCHAVSKGSAKSKLTPLPCRGICEDALKQSRGSLTKVQPELWPVRCHTLPTDNCFTYDDKSGLTFVKGSTSNNKKRNRQTEVASFAPLDVELGAGADWEVSDDDDDDDDEFKVEVVTLTGSQMTAIPARRYDIADLGDPELFQGWVDVQGTGAANDYCRVVGKAKRRYLSCNLAGSSGQGHHYVSKLGFDLGHSGTWFMRDMDGDGRDDYCRCVGTKAKSHVTCMKAGEKGFFGSTTQGGDEHSFTLPHSGHCVDTPVNTAFGQ